MTAADPERAAAYAPHVLAAAPRLLSLLDREPASRSYGSFDRDHWGWKFRDFPIVMLQWGTYPLALLFRSELPGSPWRGSEALLAWTRAAHAELLRRQHTNGAFDSVAPYTMDHGSTLASAYYLVETARALGDALPEAEQVGTRLAVERALAFARRSREDYAFLSNHQALFALGLHSAAEWLGDARAAEESRRVVRAILAHQSPDGFYAEYGGFDPGYETLGIDYLARLWERTRDAELLASLRRAVEFFAHAVHPDGSVGGPYGSRHTRLYFPAGFEILASESATAAGVAAFVRARLDRGEVATPANVDAHNLAVLLASYLQAGAVAARPLAPAPLPCEALAGERRFESGLLVAGGERYYAVFSLARGGVGRVHERPTGALAYEDAGWLVRSGGRLYASQLAAESRPGPEAAPALARVRLARARQEELTPLRFLLLRLANLTVFRSVALGALVRRAVVARLITGVEGGPFWLERSVRCLPDRIEVRDRLRAEGRPRVESADLARAFTAVHMGSARYFHPSDAAPTPLPDAAAVASDLAREGVVELQFSLRFESGGATLVAERTAASLPLSVANRRETAPARAMHDAGPR